MRIRKRAIRGIAGGLATTLILSGALVGAAIAPGAAGAASSKNPSSYTVGGNLCLSGPAGPNGQHMQEGMNLGAKVINANGGIDGAKIKTVYQDSQNTAQLGLSAAQKLIEVDNATALTMCGSTVLQASLQVAKQQPGGVMLINGGAQAPDLAGLSKYVISNIINGATEADGMMNYLAKIGRKNVCLFTATDDFGSGILKTWEANFQKLGGHIACTQTITYTQSDFRSAISTAETSHPDAFVVYTYGDAIIPFMQQAKALNVTVPTYSFGGIQTDTLIGAKGVATRGLTFTAPYFNLKASTALTKQFVAAYAKSGDTTEPPNFYVIGYYEAMFIFKDLEQYVRSHNLPNNGNSLAKAVAAIRTFPGIGGKIRINPNGTVTRPLSLQKVGNGKFVILSTNVKTSIPK